MKLGFLSSIRILFSRWKHLYLYLPVLGWLPLLNTAYRDFRKETSSKNRKFKKVIFGIMPSWKHNVLKNALNTLSVPMYWKLPPIDHLRGLLETFTMFATLPWGVSRGEVEFKEFRADWLVPDKRSAEDVILYLHGGGYVIGSPHSHRGLAGKIAKDAGMACLLIDYRKAPEYPFPYALYDAYKAYEYLLGQGYEPGHIFIIGDSAGGGLTLSLSLKLKMDKMPLPAANVLLSPYVDLVNNEDDGSTMLKTTASLMYSK
jgi:acetyl esterase/lipase